MTRLLPKSTIADEVSALERAWRDPAKSYDFFFLHVKGTDSAGEDGDEERKARVVEEFDREVPRIRADMVARMEKDIDRLTAELPEMRQFILPGGSRPGAALHLCRTVCRRAERAAEQLAREETVAQHVLAYLNRLSDLLFVLARAANLRAGGREIPWVAPKP